MGVDPNQPGYTPDYTGPDPSLGDVGHGNQFGVDLHAMYESGRIRMPRVAQDYAAVATATGEHRHSVSRQAGVVSAAGSSAIQAILDLQATLQSALRETAINVRDVGALLVETADLFAATDAAAAAEFADLISRDGLDAYAEPTPVIPDPPTPDQSEHPPVDVQPTHGPF
jgi:hypothetical protein